MKKLVLVILSAAVFFVSCKKDDKKDGAVETASTPGYVIDPSASSITWTAYKTTAKTPVSGKFTQLKVNNPIASETIQGALNGLDFEIPIASFFSNNDVRDNKIKAVFWGVMNNTSFINGTFKDINGDDKSGTATVSITMNQVAKDVTLQYTIAGNKMTFKGKLMIMDWGIKEAFDSLHKACEMLHAGDDGISKTWDEVALEAVAVIDKK
jgi:polyisoprenoid-binding protein YceI